MDVLKITAADFERNIGRYQDLALRSHVVVTRKGEENCVLISTEPAPQAPRS